MPFIELTQGKTALVDSDDYADLSANSWCAHEKTKGDGRFYAVRNKSLGNKKSKMIPMHRQVLKVTDPKIQVDHINHNTLDNRKENLRLVDHRGNASNLKAKGSKTSIYTGVRFHQKAWEADIRINGKKIYLGRFDSELKAHEAYQQAVASLRGQ